MSTFTCYLFIVCTLRMSRCTFETYVSQRDHDYDPLLSTQLSYVGRPYILVSYSSLTYSYFVSKESLKKIHFIEKWKRKLVKVVFIQKYTFVLNISKIYGGNLIYIRWISHKSVWTVIEMRPLDTPILIEIM